MKHEAYRFSKINNSSLQVLKTLQVLLQGDYTMSEIVQKLNINEKGDVFNNSVVSKYINTCRYCGIEIPNINNKYCIAGIPFGIDITDREKELLKNMEVTAKRICAPKTFGKFMHILQIISKLSNKKITEIKRKNSNELVKILENALQTQHKVKIAFKDSKEAICIPVNTEIRNDAYYVRVYSDNRESLYSFDEIREIEILKEQFTLKTSENTAIYKIYGGLSKRYQPRDYEEILTDYSPDFKTIINKGEDENELISRLLRYDYLCEITNPKSYRDKIVNVINDTLANYGEYDESSGS